MDDSNYVDIARQPNLAYNSMRMCLCLAPDNHPLATMLRGVVEERLEVISSVVLLSQRESFLIFHINRPGRERIAITMRANH